MTKQHRAIPLLIVLFSSLCAAQESFADRPGEDDSVQELASGQGYLLLEVQAHHPGTSMKAVGYRDGRSRGSPLSMGFDDKESGFRLLAVRQGTYQVLEVNAPYYDLPFRLSVDDNPAWRFKIEEGRVNYVGSLFIELDRSTTSVDIRLLNRLATNLETILTEYADLLERYPLASGAAYRDPFLKTLEELSSE